MRKVLKGTSILLSVTLVIGVISIAFAPLIAHAETFSNVSEFPDFDMDCYVADLFTTEGHSLNKGIELELNSESTNKIIKNSIESNSLLMGSMTAWQAATFEASDVTSDSVTELGYYESIILSSINTAMKSSRVKDIFDNAVIKDGKMLFSSFKDILKTEYYITDFSLKTYWSLSEENQSAYIKSFGEAFKKQYPKLDKTSDALKIFNTVVKAAKSFEECMNNYAAYAFCSLTNKHLTKVINDLYEQCPDEKVTLKAALLNISSACTSIELDFGADALDAIYRGADIVFGVLTDGLVTKIISAHPVGLAMMLGRAVGKTVSNILFSADAICENYYKMCCFDEFEKLVRSVTRYEMGTYTKNKTNDNANNMFWAIRLMYNINEVSCDLSIDYAKTIYEKSVAGIFLDKTEYENFKKSVEFIRNCKQSNYSSLMTSYVFYLEEDYPEIYAAYKKLIDEIEHPVVHATGISFSKKHMTLGLADDAWFFWNNAEVTPSNATNRAVSYSSSDESIVSIKPGNTLMIELHQTGTVTITATSEDGGFTDQLTINVVEGHGTDGIHLEDPVTNITESGKCGDIVYYNLYNDGMLKIYGNGPMWDYNLYNNTAPWKNLSVKQVVIENGVTSIGVDAFEGCTGLTSVTIPNSVTSIGVDAFDYCKRLTSITIPNSVTSIGAFAFEDCTSLTSVIIPNSVTSINFRAFYGCTGLTSVTIPDSVTSIGNSAFSGCTGLTSVTIPNSVTSIGDDAFYGCEGLTRVSIPDSMTSIGWGAFDDCSGLKEVHITDLSAWCNISFSNYGSNPLYYAPNLYLNNRLITELVIPDSVTSIGDNAFYGCTGLTSVTIPNSVTSIGDYAFDYCKRLTSITIPDSVTSIGDYAFRNCTGLTSITIPDSVTSIGDYAFSDCTGLTSVTIPDSVTSIGEGAFSSCTGLTSVTIPDSVKSIGERAFYGCTGLTSVTIPDSVTSIGDDAFRYCTGLKSVTIPDSVTSIGWGAFFGCTGLTSVTIPNSVTSIGGGAFENCKGLTSVTIPDSVTSIGSYAFEGCTGLTSVTIPDSVTSIDYHAFGYYYDSGDRITKKIDNFTIYGSKGSAAEAYANENGFKFIEMSNFIEKTDKQSNVSVVMTTDLDLNVKEVTQSNTVKSIVLQTGESVINAYDITMLKNGKKTQPDGSVTVKIPCDNSKAKVYRVESDKTLTDMNAVYQDGFMVFTTNHFSIYVVAASTTILTGDLNGDGKVNGADAGILSRYTSGWKGYADKIKNMNAADINGDGKVNGADAGLLSRYTSGWSSVKKYFTA